jgi:EAL domain-containing protein (putative c-di-GMP-specific phosphodiesterase class I)/FixJ family two-component response regulator
MKSGWRSDLADRIRVLIADDDPDIREVLADLIAGDASLELAGIAEDADQAVELARAHLPDVALLDVKMPGGGASAARAIRARSPGTAIVAFTAHEDETSVKEMLGSGAGSYLVKGSSSDEILAAIHGSVGGLSILSGRVASKVVGELATRLQRERPQETRRTEWKRRIDRILDGHDELATVFQPIVDLETGRIVGLEALSRFKPEPVFGPDVWFAEATLLGRRSQLELAAVQAAVSRLAEIPPDVFLSVNVSPEVVASSVLRQALDPIRADRLVLEITEHAAVSDYPKLRSAITLFRNRGVGIAIDDAGAGFASLRHILQLTPDFMKLDIALTRGIDTDRNKRALAAALVTFAKEIEATIIAEGIETSEELTVLRGLGVTLGQGYYLGRPGALPHEYMVPWNTLAHLVSANERVVGQQLRKLG